MSITPDFATMTKEEIVAYYQEQQEHQNQIINNLRKKVTEVQSISNNNQKLFKEKLDKTNKKLVMTENKLVMTENKLAITKKNLTNTQEKLEIEKSDNKKLSTHNQNLKDILRNILSNIRDHQTVYHELLREENIPNVDTYNVIELNMYFEELMPMLMNAVSALMLHQQKSLGLGTSERNRPEEPQENYSSDQEARLDGLKELNSVAEVSCDTNDIRDYEEQSEGFILENNNQVLKDQISNQDNNQIPKQEAKGLTSEEIKNVILATCSTSKAESIEQTLSNNTKLIKKLNHEIKNDCDSLHNTRRAKEPTKFISVNDSNQVAGIIKNNSGSRVVMYCSVCGKPQEFKRNPKNKRINSILTVQGGINNLRTVLTSVQTAECSCCGTSVEINPAEFNNFAVVTEQYDKSLAAINNLETVNKQSSDKEEASNKFNLDNSETTDKHCPNNSATSNNQFLNNEETNKSLQNQEVIKNLSQDKNELKTSENQKINNNKISNEQKLNSFEMTNKNAINASDMISKQELNKESNRQRQSERKQQYNDIKKSENALTKDFILAQDLISIEHSNSKFNANIDNTSKADTSKVDTNEFNNKFNNKFNKVINPITFDAETFGMAPAFIKSRLSTTLITSWATQFSQLGAPKNRIFNLYEGNGFPMSREHLTGATNAFARAFLHPMSNKIKHDILQNSKAVIMDESTIIVRETSDRKQQEGGSRKSQIWTLNSSWTSPIKASWFCVSESRTSSNVVDILKDDAKNSVLSYVISDGYTGYDSGLKILQNQYGISLLSARCWTHGRRPLHKILDQEGLLKIYNQELLPKGAFFCDFEENLKKYRSTKNGSKLSERSIELLTIYYLINALFVIDSSIVRKHHFQCTTEEFKQDLLKERTDKSSKIVDAIFDSIRLFIAKYPYIMNVKTANNGAVSFIQNKRYPESRALIYLLKYEKNLREFTGSVDVELSSSAAERSLKLGICTRHSCMFLQSEDGAGAFADFQTIVNTCIANRVPVQPYLLWLVANMKLRMQQMQLQGHGDPTFFTMPKKQQIYNEKQEVVTTLSMYDSKNKTGYDKIDLTGLAPYDYRHYLEQSISAINTAN